jgi:hypothetical protein
MWDSARDGTIEGMQDNATDDPLDVAANGLRDGTGDVEVEGAKNEWPDNIVNE